MNIIVAILVISVIIIVHEFGHFIVAKANGVMVLEFSIGFGPKLLRFKPGETEYNIKLLPFGGACIMLGDDLLNPEHSSDDEDADQEDEGAVSKVIQQYDMTRSFSSKSVWARIAILFAGPLFNFILAFVLAVVIIATIGYDPCVIDHVEENTPGYEAGLTVGDKVCKINGRGVTFARELSNYSTFHPDKTMNIEYERDGQRYTATVTPRYNKTVSYMIGITHRDNGMVVEVQEDSPADAGGLKANDTILSVNGNAVSESSSLSSMIQQSEGGALEFVVRRGSKELTLSVTPEKMERESYVTGLYSFGAREKVSAGRTMLYGLSEVGYWINTVFESLGMMFRGNVALDDFSGPVGIVSTIGNVVEQSKPDGLLYVFLNVLNMTVMISANLGVMNLLPLPAIDGGRLLFCILEVLRGKPISKEKEGLVHFAGMVLLLIFMVVIMVNDISNLF